MTSPTPATGDWTSDVNAPVSLPTMVSSTDLFDGELFGDELIDIYNSSVDEGVEMHGIPSLDHPTAKETDVDPEHPGAQAAAMAAAMDDGLGAFRPSTSFNDLTTLMQQPQADSTKNPPESTVSEPNSQDKKRGASDPPSAPPAKRKAAPRARKPASPKKQSPATVSKSLVADLVSSGSPLVVTPSDTAGEQAAAATVAAVEAAAAAAVAASFPALPELSRAAKDPQAAVSSVSLNMKAEEKPEDIASPTTGPSSEVTAAADKDCDSSCGTAGTNTDSQFKSIAQQAVSNLIMNAGSARVGTTAKVTTKKEVSDAGDKKVDTSTAHIKALTGNNWVAACAGNNAPPAPEEAPAVESTAPVAAPAVVASAAEKNNPNSSANRARRQNLTPDERARQNRDRNREHARNTRLRKKAYVEELKRTLTELVAQRDAADLEKRQTAQREVEQREVRFRVIEEFLKLRGRNEMNFARWSAILEDGFVLTVPSTTLYKDTTGGEASGFEQKLNSVEAVMAESTVFSGFLQTLRGDGEGVVTMVFECDRKNFFMDGCNAVLEWSAVCVGTKSEIHLKGLIRGKFSPASNKLLSANISFDSGALASFVHMKNSISAGDEVDAAAAQADAILDSLEINHVHLNVVVPSDVSVANNSSSSSVGSSEEVDASATDKDSNSAVGVDGLGMTTRRVQRRD